jgi:hypothetical protein
MSLADVTLTLTSAWLTIVASQQQASAMATITDSSEPVYSPALAAVHLSQRLGLTRALWIHRLANWRRPGRSSPVPVHTTSEGSPVYRPEDLDTYIAAQLKRLAVDNAAVPGVVRPGALALLDGSEPPHVRVLFAVEKVTQSVFAIDADSARSLATMLLKAANLVETATGAPVKEELA